MLKEENGSSEGWSVDGEDGVGGCCDEEVRRLWVRG